MGWQRFRVADVEAGASQPPARQGFNQSVGIDGCAATDVDKVGAARNGGKEFRVQ